MIPLVHFSRIIVLSRPLLVVWGRGTLSILHPGLNSPGLRLRVGIVHLVWVTVSRLLVLARAILLAGIGLRWILAMALVLSVLVFIGSSVEYRQRLSP